MLCTPSVSGSREGNGRCGGLSCESLGRTVHTLARFPVLAW
jgi:hypothetical protein